MSARDPRELAAELAVLHRFNFRRRVAGHDYGNAQRFRELARREHELERIDGDLVSLALVAADVELPASMTRGLDPLTDGELAAAFERVGRPRLARLARHRDTEATRRTTRAWRSVELELALEGARA